MIPYSVSTTIYRLPSKLITFCYVYFPSLSKNKTTFFCSDDISYFLYLCNFVHVEQTTHLLEVLPKAGLVYSEKGNLSEVGRYIHIA